MVKQGANKYLTILYTALTFLALWIPFIYLIINSTLSTPMAMFSAVFGGWFILCLIGIYHENNGIKNEK